MTLSKGLNTTRTLAPFGMLQRLEITTRFCVLGAELASLATASPGLEALTLAVTEPLGRRWSERGPQSLGLHAASSTRLPSLRSLTLMCVPVDALLLDGSALPVLRHLRVSNKGYLLTQQPYRAFSVRLPALEALQVEEVTVWGHVDLCGDLAASPSLRVVSLSELWVLDPITNFRSTAMLPKDFAFPNAVTADGSCVGASGSVSARSVASAMADAPPVTECFVHELSLPNCRVLHIRNSINTLGFELWAPKLQTLHVMCNKLHRLRLMVPHPLPAAPPKQAKVTLLRGKVDKDTLSHLENSKQVSQVCYDDAVAEDMAHGLNVLARCVKLSSQSRAWIGTTWP